MPAALTTPTALTPADLRSIARLEAKIEAGAKQLAKAEHDFCRGVGLDIRTIRGGIERKTRQCEEAIAAARAGALTPAMFSACWDR